MYGYTCFSGPGIVPETVPHDVTHLILVINGRTDEKIADAKVWLEDLMTWDKPPVTIVIMLGNEVWHYYNTVLYCNFFFF